MLRRLPGLQVIVPPSQPSRLPRMDVACFVGFAERGPLHRPVLIRNMQAYGEVFGGSLALAQRAGEIHYSYLASTVRAFFANGGQLCYVIRVADAEEALLNQNVFPLANITTAVPHDDGFHFRPTYLRASSPGSWSDDIRVRTSLTADTLTVTSLQFEAQTLITPANETVQVGDMLRLSYPNDQFFVVVTAVQPNPGGAGLQVRWHPSQIIRAQMPTLVTLSGLTDLHWMSDRDTEANTPILSRAIIDEGAGELAIVVERPSAIPPTGTFSWSADNGRQLLFSADSITVNPDNDAQIIIGGRALIQLVEITAPAGAVQKIEHICLNVQTVQGDANPQYLTQLAFAPEHPRYWGNLPDDQHRYGDFPSPLAAEALEKQFPLAGLLHNVPYLPQATETSLHASLPEVMRTPFLTIPVGLGTLPSADTLALQTTVTPLERDGLSHFGAALFLDDGLTGNTLQSLLNTADDIRYRNHHTRELQGIHAALSLVDPSLIAVPDLLHAGWEPALDYVPISPEPSEPVSHPGWAGQKCDPDSTENDALESPQWQHFLDHDIRVVEPPTLVLLDDGENGRFALTWTSDEPDPIYTLEEATQHDWTDAVQIYEGTETSCTIYGRSMGDYYYRVRLRVGKNKSDWSDGVVASVPPASSWALLAPADDAVYRQVQQELLRMCAAKGTLFAILGMPAWHREADAVAYAEAMQPAAATPLNPTTVASLPLSISEQVALSYGSLFHPWLHVNDGSATRLLPPHGTITGMMAQRANNRGAWIAPANQELEAIIAMQPNLATAAWADLLTAHINIIQRRPGGFLTLSTDTLHPDNEWQDINVRRLLILLRRTLLPLAETYVFEPNNRVLERSVVRDIRAVLNDLFRLGAFAGNTPAEAFRVRVISTTDDKDAGRFIVEIKIAPSLPMTFITIHLIQGNVPRIEEV